MVGLKVIAHFAKKQDRDWVLVAKEGVVVKDFFLRTGNQSLYQVEYKDGTFDNCWNDQLEVIEE